MENFFWKSILFKKTQSLILESLPGGSWNEINLPSILKSSK